MIMQSAIFDTMKIYLYGVLALFFWSYPVSSQVVAPLTPKTTVASVETDREKVRDFNWLKSLILRNDLKSIEEVLQKLPPDYLNRYALIRFSRSPQQSTPFYPRVLMYGKDARLIMAFNGRERLSGKGPYHSLEVTEFKEHESRFAYHAIKFDPEGKSLPEIERNSPRCLHCHQQDPRPNWAQNGLWSTAYGSIHDTVKGTDPVIGKYGKDEEKLFNYFLQVKPIHKRYRYLGNIKTDSEGKLLVGNENPVAPNKTLSKHITPLNHKRMVRLMKDIPEIKSLRYLLIGVFLKCDLDSFFSSKINGSADFFNDLKQHYFNEIIPRVSRGYSLYSDRAHLLEQERPSIDYEKYEKELEGKFQEYIALTLLDKLASIQHEKPFFKWHTNLTTENYDLGNLDKTLHPLALPFADSYLDPYKDALLKYALYDLPNNSEELIEFLKLRETSSYWKNRVCTRLSRKNERPFRAYLQKQDSISIKASSAK